MKTAQSDKKGSKLYKKDRSKQNIIKTDNLSNKSNNPTSLISIHRMNAPQKHYDNSRSTWVQDSDFQADKFSAYEENKISSRDLKLFILKAFTIFSIQIL